MLCVDGKQRGTPSSVLGPWKARDRAHAPSASVPPANNPAAAEGRSRGMSDGISLPQVAAAAVGVGSPATGCWRSRQFDCSAAGSPDLLVSAAVQRAALLHPPSDTQRPRPPSRPCPASVDAHRVAWRLEGVLSSFRSPTPAPATTPTQARQPTAHSTQNVLPSSFILPSCGCPSCSSKARVLVVGFPHHQLRQSGASIVGASHHLLPPSRCSSFAAGNKRWCCGDALHLDLSYVRATATTIPQSSFTLLRTRHCLGCVAAPPGDDLRAAQRGCPRSSVLLRFEQTTTTNSVGGLLLSN